MTILRRARRLPLPRRAAAARTPEPVLELDDIQGNILKGYRHPACSYLFFTVVDPEAARSWLAELAAIVQSAADRPGTWALNVGLSCAGLRALAVPEARLAQLPAAFQAGMAVRAGLLGDPVQPGRTPDLAGEPSAWLPSGWQAPFGPDGDLHLLVVVSGEDDAVVKQVEDLRGNAWQGGVAELDGAIHAHRLPGDVEHFGYVDGLTNPIIEGVARPGGRLEAPLPAGEFILGLPTLDGTVIDDVPSLTRNGSYLVLRKLEQDADRYEEMVRASARRTGLSENLIRAKLMGRWPHGAPVTSYRADEPDSCPDSCNHSGAHSWADTWFDYTDDAGEGCPVGAHIRRANPRGGLGFDGRLENRHRILRRGMPYGRRASQPGSEGYGLVFACYQADIARQFEFVQSQWLGDGNIFALGTATDPIAATGAEGGYLVLPSAADDTQPPAPQYLDTVQGCVTCRGGEYFLVPGIRTLRHLSRSPEHHRKAAP